MKLFLRLAFLSFALYIFIQYSISIRIDANIEMLGKDSGIADRVDDTSANRSVEPAVTNSMDTGNVVGTLNPISVNVPTQQTEQPEPADSITVSETSVPLVPTDSINSTKPDETNNDSESPSATPAQDFINTPAPPAEECVNTPVPPTNTDLAPFESLPYFVTDYSERYVAYKLNNPDFTHERVVTFVNIGLDKPFYTDINVTGEPESLTVLINKYNKLPDGYVPKLKQIDPAFCDPAKGKQYLRPEAKEAFEKMCTDAKAQGLNILVYDSYRSLKAQDYIWEKKIKDGVPIEEIDAYNAKGGHSEHNAGLAVDISGKYAVVKTKEFEWYTKNAYKYGFILRYPYGHESITGYKYEPWHLRYVGAEMARAVYKSGLTYDEYYVRYVK